MSIEEIKKEHEKFEAELHKLVNDFCKNTKCFITVVVGTTKKLDGSSDKELYITTRIENPF